LRNIIFFYIFKESMYEWGNDMKAKIMVVDDEPSIVTLLSVHLQKADYEVLTASDGQTALKEIISREPDLIVLDLMLPGMDGLDVCRKLREQGIFIPIIMLTAKDDELDKVLGLELGADDYIIKPFSPREVISRIKAVLRRTTIQQMQSFEKYRVGALEIFPQK